MWWKIKNPPRIKCRGGFSGVQEVFLGLRSSKEYRENHSRMGREYEEEAVADGHKKISSQSATEGLFHEQGGNCAEQAEDDKES